MQQTMHSYVYGINLRSESSLVLSDLHFAINRCTRIRKDRVYRAKSKYDLMKIPFELVFIPKTQESICCCMTFPDFFYFLHRAVGFNSQPDVEHSSVW